MYYEKSDITVPEVLNNTFNISVETFLDAFFNYKIQMSIY